MKLKMILSQQEIRKQELKEDQVLMKVILKNPIQVMTTEAYNQ